MFYGVLNEGYILSEKDIKYQVDEFESGKIQNLFITGQSGSGKSTLGRKYSNDLKISYYDLDAISVNHQYTDDQIKEMGSDLWNFFNGTGKKYRSHPDPKDPKKAIDADWNIDECMRDFVKYIISKKARCVAEGTQIFQLLDQKMIDIEIFKNSAVIIKGTSALKSIVRAMKRDYIDNKPEVSIKDAFKDFVNRVKWMMQDEAALKQMRKYYKKKDK